MSLNKVFNDLKAENKLDIEGDLTDTTNSNTIYDISNQYVPLTILESKSVTVAGNSVSLGGSTAVSIDDLSDAASSSESAGQLPIWNNTAGEYQNSTLTGGNSIDVTNADASITLAVTSSGIQTNELDLSIAPTWTGKHDYEGHMQFSNNSTIEHDRQDVSSNISTDGSGYYSVDSSGGSRTITISSSDEVDGREINFKRNGANNVDINTHDPSTTTIDGASTTPQLTLGSDNDSATLVYNSTNDDWELY